MWEINDTGINKCYEGPERVSGQGYSLIDKKAYPTRAAREEDRQKRAGREANALKYGAAGAGTLGAALMASPLRKPAKAFGAQALGALFRQAKKGPVAGKRVVPKSSFWPGAALTAAAPAAYVGGRRIEEGKEDEWR